MLHVRLTKYLLTYNVLSSYSTASKQQRHQCIIYCMRCRSLLNENSGQISIRDSNTECICKSNSNSNFKTKVQKFELRLTSLNSTTIKLANVTSRNDNCQNRRLIFYIQKTAQTSPKICSVLRRRSPRRLPYSSYRSTFCRKLLRKWERRSATRAWFENATSTL